MPTNPGALIPGTNGRRGGIVCTNLDFVDRGRVTQARNRKNDAVRRRTKLRTKANGTEAKSRARRIVLTIRVRPALLEGIERKLTLHDGKALGLDGI